MPLIYQGDSLSGYSYIPNLYSEIKRPGISKRFQINNIGFFDSHRSPSKHMDTFRIFVTGASQTTGIWMNGETPYSLVADSIFKASGYKVEVLNGGIDGNSRDLEQLRFIENKILSLQTDLIISEFPSYIPIYYRNWGRANYKNYVIEYKGDSVASFERSKRIVDNLNKYKYITCIYDASYVVRALSQYYCYRHRTKLAKYIYWYWKKIIYIPGDDDFVFYLYPTEKCSSLYKELNEKIIHQNSRWVALSYSHKVSEEGAIFFAKANIPILKLSWSSNNRDITNKYDIHFNQYANYLIGRSLFEALIQSKLIPDKYLNNENN